jgi:hypothetical protein
VAEALDAVAKADLMAVARSDPVKQKRRLFVALATNSAFKWVGRRLVQLVKHLLEIRLPILVNVKRATITTHLFAFACLLAF